MLLFCLVNTRSKHLIISCKRNVKCKKGKSIKNVYFWRGSFGSWTATQNHLKTAQIFGKFFFTKLPTLVQFEKATKPVRTDTINYVRKSPVAKRKKRNRAKFEQKVVVFDLDQQRKWNNYKHTRVFWMKFSECQSVF